jgi:hypothetical protein
MEKSGYHAEAKPLAACLYTAEDVYKKHLQKRDNEFKKIILPLPVQ